MKTSTSSASKRVLLDMGVDVIKMVDEEAEILTTSRSGLLRSLVIQTMRSGRPVRPPDMPQINLPKKFKAAEEKVSFMLTEDQYDFLHKLASALGGGLKSTTHLLIFRYFDLFQWDDSPIINMVRDQLLAKGKRR